MTIETINLTDVHTDDLPVAIDYSTFAPHAMLVKMQDGTRFVLVHDINATPDVAAFVMSTQDFELIPIEDALNINFVVEEFFAGALDDDIRAFTLLAGDEITNEALFFYSDTDVGLAHADYMFGPEKRTLH